MIMKRLQQDAWFIRMKKKALISGITGQDGSYLAELLLGKGYEVHGLILENDPALYLRAIRDSIYLHSGSIVDYQTWVGLLQKHGFDEIYHFAAQSHVGNSFGSEFFTIDLNTRSVYSLLTAVKEVKPDAKVFFPASAEIFKKEHLVNEETAIEPANPYGISKAVGLNFCRYYRKAYGMFVSTGILFNHESPRRGSNFVTQKICLAFKRMQTDSSEVLELGNLDAERDWGFAPEYVEAIWRMLQAENPDDIILATGETHSIREWVEAAAGIAGFEINWQGKGVDEQGLDAKTGRLLVKVNSEFFRPGPDVGLSGNASRAELKLGWKARLKMREIVKTMMVG